MSSQYGREGGGRGARDLAHALARPVVDSEAARGLPGLELPHPHPAIRRARDERARVRRDVERPHGRPARAFLNPPIQRHTSKSRARQRC